MEIHIKSVVILLTLGMTFSLQANASTCFDKISSINGDFEINEARLQCMRADSGFSEATALLCSKNQKDVSSEYSQYLSYQKKYQQAFDSYSKESDPGKKSLLLSRVQQADDHWMLAGYRGEVDYALLQIFAALKNCTKN